MSGLPIPTLPSLTTIKFALAGIALLAALGGGFYAGYRWELGIYEKRVAADALAVQKAQAAAIHEALAINKANDAAAQKDAQAQQQIVTRTVTITREVTVHVHDQVFCPGPTVGLARVLRAAAAGVDPTSLDLAPGQSDDSCSDVTASEVASWFTAYAGTAQQNSQQLNDLIAAVKANDASAAMTK